MTTKVFTYKSAQKTLNSGNVATVLETVEKDGIKHTWSGYVEPNHCDVYQAHLTWKFDWEDLRNEGVDRLVGHLIVNSLQSQRDRVIFYIDCTASKQTVFAMFRMSQDFNYCGIFNFEYNLTAHYAEIPQPEKMSYDKMFVASDMTDMALIVQGKKLNVNKSFLSLHSDYFATLFSANFKEGQMEEIEIKEVSYKDFALFLSSFHSNRQYPNDHTVEKLLAMASRFQVSSVIRIIEYHLLNNSKIGIPKILWLADEYGLPTLRKLLEKCINQMNSAEKARKLRKSPEFEKLSVNTRSLILERVLKFF
ncbi:unnamed protein product [Caenorhabditis nigoni]